MSFINVYIHFVWSTKNRLPLLASRSKRIKVWNHIRNTAISHNIFIDHANGFHDHCHCLVSMKSTQTMEQVMKIIKGESSRWINEANLCNGTFEWQDDYYAASVSPNMIEKVRAYIRNQEAHHKNKSFGDELKVINELIHFKSPSEDEGN